MIFFSKKPSQSHDHDCRPNPPLNPDPTCIAFRSLSLFCFLGFAQRLGAGGSG
jgi:hypothetical protein